MTVSEDGARSRPRMDAELKAKLGAEAWALKDRQGMSTRQIAALFTKRGHEISHVQVWRLIQEAYSQAQFLDLVGPAESRAGAIGRIDTYIEKTLAAIEAGEVEFDKGMARVIQLEQMLMKLTGSAMPSRVEVTSNGEDAVPNMPLLRELDRQAREYARQTEEREAGDGLE